MSHKIKYIVPLCLGIWALGFADSSTSQSTPMLQFGLIQSEEYGDIGHGQFANKFGQDNAMAFLLDFGSDQFRADITWARQLTENQRLKIGVEHFAQDNQFQFVSGEDHEFIGQNSVGASYQYLFNSKRLAALTLTGYYAGANNGDFDPVTYYVSNTRTATDYRDVIGATIAGVGFGPTTHLWRGALLTTNINYDSVSYSPTYESDIGSHGIGPYILFFQQISPRLSGNLSANVKQPYQVYQANINWLAYSKPTHSVELGLLGGHFHSVDTWQTSDTYAALNVTFKWGAAPKTLTNDYSDLQNWTLFSPASLPAVFVMKDEHVQ